MGARKPAEERFFPRYLNVSKGFSGRLGVGPDHATTLLCKVLDVSRDGLGILADAEVKAGETVGLTGVADHEIVFKVAHCEPDLIYKGKYRVGLQQKGTENLVSLFRAKGLIDDK